MFAALPAQGPAAVMNAPVGVAVEKVQPLAVHMADHGPVVLVSQQHHPVGALVEPLLALREDMAGAEFRDIREGLTECEGPASFAAGPEEVQQRVKLVRFSAGGQADGNVIFQAEPVHHCPEQGLSSEARVEPAQGIHHTVQSAKGVEVSLHGRPQGVTVLLFHILSHLLLMVNGP